jgi:hypothetical protein
VREIKIHTDALERATNFQDLEVKDKSQFAKTRGVAVTDVVECPLCHGYGGWNIRLDAYGPGRHFKAMCYQCSGWGWVDGNTIDAYCVHQFREIDHRGARKLGMKVWGTRRTDHYYVCEGCGKTKYVDSSG